MHLIFRLPRSGACRAQTQPSRVSVYMYTHTHTHTHTHTYIHTQIRIHTYIHTFIHTHTHTYIHTYIHTYMYAIARLLFYTHTHTQTHTHCARSKARDRQYLYSASRCLFSSDTTRACAAAGAEGFADGASSGAPLSIATARLRLLLVRACTAPGLFNPFSVTVTTTASSSSACACCLPPFRIRRLLSD